jgi:TetR/AcrR family transcriptional regulator, fatty acid biosynthesis regulator
MAAALRLAAERRGLHGLGVRELGRAAGLNPNTFYRHFEDLEDLGVAMLDAFTRDLGPALHAIRLDRDNAVSISRRTVEYVFDYAGTNPEAFLVGVRELHGPSTRLREALRGRIAELGEDMVRDLATGPSFSAPVVAALRSTATALVEYVFHRTLDYLEAPAQRAALVERTTGFIDILFVGIFALHSPRQPA